MDAAKGKNMITITNLNTLDTNTEVEDMVLIQGEVVTRTSNNIILCTIIDPNIWET